MAKAKWEYDIDCLIYDHEPLTEAEKHDLEIALGNAVQNILGKAKNGTVTLNWNYQNSTLQQRLFLASTS